MIEVDAKTGKKSYRAASPDEGAFVLATKCLGWEFSERTLTTVTLTHQGRCVPWLGAVAPLPIPRTMQHVAHYCARAVVCTAQRRAVLICKATSAAHTPSACMAQ